MWLINAEDQMNLTGFGIIILVLLSKYWKQFILFSCRQTNGSSLLKHCSTFFFDQKCPTFCLHWLAYSKSRVERLNCQNLRFSQLYCHINYMLLYQIVSCLTLLYIALIFFQDTEIHVTTVGAGVLKQSCITGKVSVLKF